MKPLFIIANWKSHMTTSEAETWLEEYRVLSVSLDLTDKKIIICPPFPLLAFCKAFILKHNLSLSLGAQTISSFDEGAYTGQVSARLVKDFCEYTLIGHSETRKYFHLTPEDIANQVKQARAYQLSPLVLVGDTQEKLPEGVDIVMYEPPSAISSSEHPQIPTPQEVEAAVGLLKAQNNVVYVLYGGSVSAKDVAAYTRLQEVHGVIVGAASLHPSSFIDIITNA